MKKMRKVYLLSIKRSNISPKELMGVFSSLCNAKSAVKNVYFMYEEVTKKMGMEIEKGVEEYKEELWERHPDHQEYFFYPLNNTGTAFFEIFSIGLNQQALSFRKPSNETIDNYINRPEEETKTNQTKANA